MKIFNIIFIFILYFYSHPIFSANKFNLVPIEVSKNVYVFLGDIDDVNNNNVATPIKIFFLNGFINNTLQLQNIYIIFILNNYFF